MLNTLHLTIVFTLMLIPTYETFPTFHQCFLRCRLLPSWPSCISSSLSRTFSPFWPRVTAKKYLDMWDRHVCFYHYGMQHCTALHFGFNTCATTCKIPCPLIFAFTMHRYFLGRTFLGRNGMKSDFFSLEEVPAYQFQLYPDEAWARRWYNFCLRLHAWSEYYKYCQSYW